MIKHKITRRQQFCQIQSEITGSDQYLVVGIDVGKRGTSVLFLYFE
ncbi:MAG: hypothetical protein V3V51_06190 [Desulfobacterales bacterium]